MTAKDIVDIGRRMYDKGHIVAHDGNLSVFHGNTVYITPANISKGFMHEDQIVEMTLDGNVLNAAVPSTEYKMHLAIYRNNRKARAIVHSHPIYATTYACMGMPLKSELLAEAKFQLGDIPLVKYQVPGTDEAAESCIPYCNDYNGLLLEKHGLVTWGVNLTDAYFKTEIAEFLARITYNIGRSDR
ncbi:MAG: class II aldolase family protein [Firmicutes bacterium HGW-Firmicutes-21]|nr:MAG: class II aldolase family protein [Firmicutes bacterium HGW-Firmicutes-21]